jgi:type VI secretion system secreted protein VgrG
MAIATPAQTNRPIAVKVDSVPEDKLLINGFNGREAMSSLFEFRLDVEVAPNATVGFDQMLGKSVTIKLAVQDDKSRFFNGICARVAQSDPSEATKHNLLVVPKLWLLTRKSNRRVFQKKTVVDVLKQVLSGIDVSWKVQGELDSHNLIVQYDETDFAFASRLMEEEGLFYYFQHEDGGHKLVIANTPSGHKDTDPSDVVYDLGRDRSGDSGRVFDWMKSQEIRSTKFTVRDHSFELTGKDLEASKQIMDSAASGTVTHKLKVASIGDLELYEYPGGYAHRFDGVESGASALQKNFQSNVAIAQRRIDQEALGALESSGSSDIQAFSPGFQFTLKEHPHADGKYVLTSVQHSASLGAAFRTGDEIALEYENRFTCIPSAIPYRPTRVTPRPLIHGLQSAVVTGPPGEEIYVDKYGRVRIQFHWDREGKKNEASTCWVRVAQTWSGQQWGSFFWPRMGHEVLVAFMEGDPDQPVIVGSVYNDANMPPYALPDHKTRSGIKTRSTLQGSSENFNELRFEDKKGSEEIYVHAERDMNRVVENNDTVKIGFSDKDKGDQTTEIFNNQTYRVGAEQCNDGTQEIFVWNNQFIGVGAGEGKNADGSQAMSIWNTQSMNIGAGKGQASDGSQIVSIWKDRTVTLNTGSDTLTLDKGNRTATLSMGNDALTIKMGNQTTKLDLGASSTEAMQAIELKVGQSSIKIDQMGVTIKGMMIKIEGTMQTSVKGLMTQVNGDAMLMVKGGLTMIN